MIEQKIENMDLASLTIERQKIDAFIIRKRREEEIIELKEKLAILESGKEVFECPNCDGIFPALEHDVSKCNYLNR